MFSGRVLSTGRRLRPRHLIGYGVCQSALGVAMLPLNTADLAAHKGTDPEVYRGE